MFPAVLNCYQSFKNPLSANNQADKAIDSDTQTVFHTWTQTYNDLDAGVGWFWMEVDFKYEWNIESVIVTGRCCHGGYDNMDVNIEVTI